MSQVLFHVDGGLYIVIHPYGAYSVLGYYLYYYVDVGFLGFGIQFVLFRVDLYYDS